MPIVGVNEPARAGIPDVYQLITNRVPFFSIAAPGGYARAIGRPGYCIHLILMPCVDDGWPSSEWLPDMHSRVNVLAGAAASRSNVRAIGRPGQRVHLIPMPRIDIAGRLVSN